MVSQCSFSYRNLRPCLFCSLCELSVPIPCPFFYTVPGLFFFHFQSSLIYQKENYFAVWIVVSQYVLWIFSLLLWFLPHKVVLIFTYFINLLSYGFYILTHSKTVVFFFWVGCFIVQQLTFQKDGRFQDKNGNFGNIKRKDRCFLTWIESSLTDRFSMFGDTLTWH